jgi:hypothetical protein
MAQCFQAKVIFAFLSCSASGRNLQPSSHLKNIVSKAITLINDYSIFWSALYFVAQLKSI